MTMLLIETKTLGTAAAAIEFTSIPQTFTDLLMLISSRPATGGIGIITASLNGSTADFTNRNLEANGSGVNTGSSTIGRFGLIGDSGYTANTFANTSVYLPQYTAAINKSVLVETVTETNATTSYLILYSTLWSKTDAITSISLTASSAADFVAGSTISLYGITAGSDGITTVT